jgi:tRNA modification GTPase
MEGIDTVIVGRVNVGKSSLLNRLLNEERAIVTPTPGTTRDIIESIIHMDGLPIRLMDTAGFRRVKGEVERIGLHLTEQKLSEADLSLVVLDQSRPLSRQDQDIIDKIRKDRSLIILNKIDLPARMDEDSLDRVVKGIPMARVSALTGQGIDGLRRAIRDKVIASSGGQTDTFLAPNLRHTAALESTYESLLRGAVAIKDGLPWEIIALEISSGLGALGEITGETTTEEVLEKVFSEFCIGK